MATKQYVTNKLLDNFQMQPEKKIALRNAFAGYLAGAIDNDGWVKTERWSFKFIDGLKCFISKFKYICYYTNGKYHRINGPAVQSVTDECDKTWYIDGERQCNLLQATMQPIIVDENLKTIIHKIAIEVMSGIIEHDTNGWIIINKNDLSYVPSQIKFINGFNKFMYKNNDGVDYYYNGLLHRDNGPAVQWSNGNSYWYQNGLPHCGTGPAVQFINGLQQWFINGNQLTQNEFIAWKATKIMENDNVL